MGIWANLRTLGEEYLAKLQEIYTKRNFPLDVRGTFCDWFEEQNWNFDEKSPENALHTNELLQTLLKMIDELVAKPENDLIAQMRFYDIKKQFSERFANKPQKFVATVREILNEEQQLLTLKSMDNVSLDSASPYQQYPISDSIMDAVKPAPSPVVTDIRELLHELKGTVMHLDGFIKEYRNRQEDFILQYQDVCKIEGEIQQTKIQKPNSNQQIQMMLKKKHDVETLLRGKAEQLLKDREEIMTTLIETQGAIEMIGSRILEELLQWRMMQQKSLSGAPKPGPLDEIQEWFEALADILWHFYSLATQYKLLFDTLPITKHGMEKEQIEKLLAAVVTTFATFIMSEKQCKELLVDQKKLSEIGTCGDILNEKCMMEHNKDRTTLQAEFKNLQLKKIKRQDRKGQESVLEAKSALVFSAKLNISGDELPVSCMSVPVVVVVHGNQGPNSEATIIWDNMFSNPSRDPFEVPEEVTWKEMSVALNSRWMLTSEHELHYDHLLYLREKIFSNIADQEHFTRDTKIPWALFNKEPLKNRSFTFWEWFHGAIEVVRKNLKEHWKDQCLEFMSRQTAHAKLLEKPPGTFLIRFSDGELGAVTIAWCCERNNRKDIWYLQPWSSKDFSIRGLADRIFDIPELTHLFPDIPKESAFGRFRSNEVSTENDPSGYVHAGIIARIIPSTTNDQLSSMNQMVNSPASFHSSMMDDHSSVDQFSSNPMMYSPPIMPNISQAQLNEMDETTYQRMYEDVTSSGGSSVETFTRYLLSNQSQQY